MGEAELKKDTLYLHMFPRSLTRCVPNLSPFAVKVETWLRANNISYEVVECMRFSKTTEQIPFLIYNGEEVADSTKIIEYVAKLKGINLKYKLTKEQLASSYAFNRMLDDGTSWTCFLHRYVYSPDAFSRFYLSPYNPQGMRDFLKENVGDRANKHGIGRKPVEDVNAIAKADVQALSDYLGDKKFMQGDKFTMVDAGVFAHLTQMVYVDLPYPQTTYMKENCKNLITYLDRVRDLAWPDWGDIVNDTPFDSQ